jgi:hypothetical protein
MGYNTILSRAGTAAEPAVRDLASCEDKGLKLNRASFEALSATRRSAVIGLQPHAAGTACEAWFPQLRASHLTGTMEGMQGTLYWPGTSRPDPSAGWQINPSAPPRPSGSDPIGSGKVEQNTNDFATWMRGGPVPSGSGAKMNCWEVVMYSAYLAGLVSQARLRTIHADAAKAASAGGGGSAYYASLYSALGGPGTALGAKVLPARGDLVFFDFPAHVALALGTRDAAGEREVMSLWILPPDPTGTRFVNNVQRTTIEALIRAMVAVGVPAPSVRHAANPF